MADIDAAAVRAKIPELTVQAYPDAAVTAAIGTAKQIAAATDEIWLHCTAHLLVLPRTTVVDGGRGEVKSELEGPKQVQYMTQARDERDVFFSTTAYGRLVLMLEERSPAAQFSCMFQ